MIAHVRNKKESLAFSKFDAGGPEKLVINFAWPKMMYDNYSCTYKYTNHVMNIHESGI